MRPTRTAINGQVRGAALEKATRLLAWKIERLQSGEIRSLEEKEATDEKKKQDEHDQNILDSLFQPARGLTSQALDRREAPRLSRTTSRSRGRRSQTTRSASL